MFCTNCGQQNADDSMFCTACGCKLEAPVEQAPVYEEPTPQEPVCQEPEQPIPQAPAQQEPTYQPPVYQPPVQNQTPADYQYQMNALRNSEMNALSVAWNYFAQLRGKYQEYDRVCKQVMHCARGAKSALLVWGSIALGIGLFFALAFATDPDARGTILELTLPFICLFGIPGLLMIGGGILMKVNNRKKREKYQKLYVEQAWELYSYYAAYPGCPVGMEYSNPDAIAYMMKLLQSGRAYTIRDSINLMVSERAGRINGHTAKLVRSTQSVNPQGNIPIFLPGALFRF